MINHTIFRLIVMIMPICTDLILPQVFTFSCFLRSLLNTKPHSRQEENDAICVRFFCVIFFGTAAVIVQLLCNNEKIKTVSLT